MLVPSRSSSKVMTSGKHFTKLERRWLSLRQAGNFPQLRNFIMSDLMAKESNATCTLRTDTNNNESWDLGHQAMVVVSAIQTIHINTTHLKQLLRCMAVAQTTNNPECHSPTDNLLIRLRTGIVTLSGILSNWRTVWNLQADVPYAEDQYIWASPSKKVHHGGGYSSNR